MARPERRLVDEATRDGITWVLGTLLTVCILLGMAVRFVLLPWLRDHLAAPVDEVRRQVTENHHKHTPPTLPDRIESLGTDVNALTRVLEGHLESSDRWLEHITERLSIISTRVERVEGRVANMLTRHRDAGTQERPAAQALSPDARAAGLSPPVSPPDVDDATPVHDALSQESTTSQGKE